MLSSDTWLWVVAVGASVSALLTGVAALIAIRGTQMNSRNRVKILRDGIKILRTVLDFFR